MFTDSCHNFYFDHSIFEFNLNGHSLKAFNMIGAHCVEKLQYPPLSPTLTTLITTAAVSPLILHPLLLP